MTRRYQVPAQSVNSSGVEPDLLLTVAGPGTLKEWSKAYETGYTTSGIRSKGPQDARKIIWMKIQANSLKTYGTPVEL